MAVDLAEVLDVLIVGGGPTGIAAAYWCRRAGLRSLTIEAGDGWLAQLRRYPEQLVFVSPASHFEIDGYPLDCRDPRQLTREELLHYYGRLIVGAELPLVADCQAVALRHEPPVTLVGTVSSRGVTRELRARHVIFTAWFEPTPLPPTYVDPTGSVTTYTRTPEQSALAAGDFAVIGGGLSARERAVALMMTGRTVHVFARRGFSPVFQEARFRRLLEATRSRLYQRAEVQQVDAEGIVYRRGQQTTHVRCAGVVACLGARVSAPALELLARADVIDPATADRLLHLESPDSLLRRGLAPHLTQAVDLAVEAWPDLGRHLFVGRRGVRFAGGVLHVGGPDAGVRTSIETSRLAVQSIVEAGPVDGPEDGPEVGRAPDHLPAWLRDWARVPPPAVPRFETLAPLLTLALDARVPTALPVHQEDEQGLLREVGLPGPGFAATDGVLAEPLAQWLLRLSDGRSNLGSIAGQLGLTSPDELSHFARLTCHLLRCGVLTWIHPPALSLGRLDRRSSASASKA